MLSSCARLKFTNMSEVFIESLGVRVNPEKRLVILDDGTTRELTKREYQIFKAVVSGAKYIHEIARFASEEDRHARQMNGHVDNGNESDTVTTGSAAKFLSTLRAKLGEGKVPNLKRRKSQ